MLKLKLLDVIVLWIRALAEIIAILLLAALLILATLTVTRVFGLWPTSWLLWELQVRQALGL